jgi:hypothetical protein
METLKLDWHNDTQGSMVIAMDRFFPCAKAKMKRLLKLINASNCSQDLIKQISDFLQLQLPELKSQTEQYSSDYFKHRQNVTDLSEIIESGRQTNGFPIRQNKLTELKRTLCQEKSNMNKALRAFKHTKKLYEQCKMNIEVAAHTL